MQLDTDDLRCPICFAVMLAPRVLPGCMGQRSHSFCGPCINFWLQLQRDSGLPATCPIDRRVIREDECVTRDYALEAAIARILVRCPNHRLGCTARFELSEGTVHLDTCAYRTVQCPQCGKPQSAERLAVHIKRCFVACGKCGINVPRADEMSHNLSLCLARDHQPWWPPSKASQFTIFRDAATSQLSWLVDGTAAVSTLAERLCVHHMERQRDGCFEAWTHASDEDAHATLRECKLKEKAEVMLTGRGELAAAGIAGSLNGQIATVVSFSVTKNKYIVRLESGCCVAAPPANVVSTKLNLENFVAALHGFDGAAQYEVRAI